jgi:hypothetical protein
MGSGGRTSTCLPILIFLINSLLASSSCMQIGLGMAHVHTHLRVQVQHPDQREALELSRSARPASTGLARGSRPSPSRLCGILGPLGSTPGQLMCRDKISTSQSKPQNEQQPNKSATAPAQRVAICSCSTLIYKREWATIERGGTRRGPREVSQGRRVTRPTQRQQLRAAPTR